MLQDFVADDELLYRRVRDVPENFKTDEQGRRWVSSQAFADREKQVSVDRATLLDHDPQCSRLEASDMIAELLTQDVRAISDVPRRDETRSPRIVDVIPDPIENHATLPDNPAHALICASPAFAERDEKHFKKLKQQLARLTRQLHSPSR